MCFWSRSRSTARGTSYMATTAETDRPNVVVIYTDDQDPARVGCYGGDVVTPAIDQLASEGTRFDRFHVTSAICAPSRFSMLTGRYASRSQRLQEAYPPGDPVKLGFEPGLVGEAHTLPRVLADHGYATGMVGKWHQGLLPQPYGNTNALREIDPAADGRDSEVASALAENYGTVVQAVESTGFESAASVYRSNPRGMRRKGQLPADMTHHNMEWVTAGALNFIDRHRDEPFFLYVAPTLTHYPWGADQLRTDRRSTPRGYLDEAPDVQRPRAEVMERNRQAGLDLQSKRVDATWVDDGIAAILDRLETHGVTDETVIIFASDNGDLRGKGTCYNGGTRMPCIVRWPGTVPAGETCDDLVANVDIAPTIFDLAGVTPPSDYHVDGQSMLPALVGHGDDRRESVFLEVRSERGIVTRDGYKYIAVRFPPEIQAEIDDGARYSHSWTRLGPGETLADCDRPGWEADQDYPAYYDQDQLYDLDADPRELRNLADDPAHKSKLTELQSLLEGYSRELPHAFGEFA